MFWSALIGALQAGQAERGTIRLKGSFDLGVCVPGSADPGVPVLSSSAHCSRHWRSRMIGRRWMTTFRKLPTIKPSTRQVTANRPGEEASSSATDIGTEPNENAAHVRGVLRLYV